MYGLQYESRERSTNVHLFEAIGDTVTVTSVQLKQMTVCSQFTLLSQIYENFLCSCRRHSLVTYTGIRKKKCLCETLNDMFHTTKGTLYLRLFKNISCPQLIASTFLKLIITPQEHFLHIFMIWQILIEIGNFLSRKWDLSLGQSHWSRDFRLNGKSLNTGHHDNPPDIQLSQTRHPSIYQLRCFPFYHQQELRHWSLLEHDGGKARG